MDNSKFFILFPKESLIVLEFMVEVSDLLIYWIKSYINSKCEKCKKKNPVEHRPSSASIGGDFWLVEILKMFGKIPQDPSPSSI
jgi:hypothetical protein